MTLSGKWLWVAMGAVLLAGGVGGSFLSGWRKAQGKGEVTEAVADAGASSSADAGVSSSSELEFHIGDWKLIPLAPGPGPSRPPESPKKGGGKTPSPGPYAAPEVTRPCPVSYIAVPDVRLTGRTSTTAEVESSSAASSSAEAKSEASSVSPDRPFELGGFGLYGLKAKDVVAGPLGGFNLGPFGARAAVGFSTAGGVYVGGAAVWRF